MTQHDTVIKPTILYASETLTLNRKQQIEEIKKGERKSLRKLSEEENPKTVTDYKRLKPQKSFQT